MDLLLRSNFSVRAAFRCLARTYPVECDVFISGDIGADTLWKEAFVGVNTLVHLAARVHVMKETDPDPLSQFRQVNVLGTERLAREAARAGIRRFIYVSSLKVNGESTGVHGCGFRETDTQNPKDFYALSKWEAEQVLHQVSQETGMEVVILRPPLVYGPGVGANFLRLLRLVQKGLPLPFGAIDNQRSLVYVGNLVDVIVTCLERPAAAGQTYLVSDGEDVSTPELIRKMADALNRPARLLSIPPAVLRFLATLTGKSGVMNRLSDSLVIDSSKIRKELDWTPPYSMAEGLKATARWCKSGN